MFIKKKKKKWSVKKAQGKQKRILGSVFVAKCPTT